MRIFVRIVLCLAAMLLAKPVSAATVRFSAVDVSEKPGVTEIRLFLDTEDIAVNVMEGSLTVSGTDIQLLETAVGSSVGSFWMEPPKRDGNTTRFSFLTPGGVEGDALSILSLFVSAPAGQYVRVEGYGMAVYQHDGSGTRIPIADQVLSYGSASLPKRAEPLEDATPPEEFTPTTVDEPLIDESPTLLFATQDEGSGLDRYELLFSNHALSQAEIDAADDWILAESPFALPEHIVAEHVYVKAVDKAGNERISHIELPAVKYTYIPWVAIAIISLLGFVLLIRHLRKDQLFERSK